MALWLAERAMISEQVLMKTGAALFAVTVLIVCSVLVRARRYVVDPHAYCGTWGNSDPHTAGIRTIEISQDHGSLLVHVWGSCVPKDCDWGTQIGKLSSNKTEVDWDLGGIWVTMVLRLEGNQVWLRADYQFDDGRAPEHETDYFSRQR